MTELTCPFCELGASAGVFEWLHKPPRGDILVVRCPRCKDAESNESTESLRVGLCQSLRRHSPERAAR